MASFWTLGRSYRVVSEDSKVAFILHAIFYRMHKILIPVIRLRFVSLIPCIRLLCGIKQVGLVVIQSNVPGLWGGLATGATWGRVAWAVSQDLGG